MSMTAKARINELQTDQLTDEELRFLLNKTEGQKAHGIFSMRRINKAVHEIIDMRNAWPEIGKEMERLEAETARYKSALHKAVEVIAGTDDLCPIDALCAEIDCQNDDNRCGAERGYCWMNYLLNPEQFGEKEDTANA